MVTERDVARAAGVSPATVSRVLNRSSRVHQETRRRVEQAIRRLNYQPHQIARSLRVRRTQTIGFLVPDIPNPFFPAVLKGMEAVFSAAGYTIILQNTNEDVHRERRAITSLLGLRVDGMVAILVRDRGPAITELARTVRPAVPIVLVDRHVPELGVDSVIIDNEAGADAAVEHLVALGHRRIGVIHGPRTSTPGYGRWAGAVRALQRHGLPAGPPYVVQGDFRKESGARLARRLLQLSQPPTALFVGNNLMTIGAYECLRDMGVQIPEAISLLGFDDFELANYLTPPLTVVDRPMEEMGRVAARTLLQRIEAHNHGSASEPGPAGDGEPRLVVLPTRLLVRHSTAAPPAQARAVEGAIA